MVRITKLKLHRTIADIMRNSDLDKLTTKKIRMMCEKKYKMDLTDRRNSKLKSEIDDIVLKFVKKKSKEEEEEEEDSNAANTNDEPSSENSDEVSGEEDDDDESSSGSESCSECSYSESSDDESNRPVPAKEVPSKTAASSKQPVAVASPKKSLITKKPAVAGSSTSKQPMAVPSTSKQPAVSVLPPKRPMRNVMPPPKKRMTSQSMNAAADDVAAIAAAAAAVAAANAAATAAATAAAAAAAPTAAEVPPKKPKSADVNNKANAAAAATSTTVATAATAVVVPCKKRNPANISNNDANNGTVMDDAAYARQLQAEEWNFRKGTINKLFRNTPLKKIDKTDQTKKKKACPFLKKCLLSPALAEILGTNEMSRPDIVQKMWSVVRERNLFDPSNKQFILCDEQLTSVFGKKRIRLIGMMKYLKQHIKDVNQQ